MKKIFALMLALLMVFAFAACGDGEEESSNVFSAAESSKSDDASATDESKNNTSESEEESKDVSDEESSESDTSAEESGDDENSEDPDENSGSENVAPQFIANFVSFGEVAVADRATSANAVQLTGIDTESSYGSVVLYSPEYGMPSADELTDHAVAIFGYDGKYFGYCKTEFFAVGEYDGSEIPEDGFALVVHSNHASYIERISNVSADTTAFPHGIRLYTGSDYTVKKATAAPNIDGVFNKSEWDAYKIDDIGPSNPDWSYAQFEVNNYYSTATYYAAYDNDYIYLCVVVESPYHYCPISASNANDMWQYECIQVKVSSKSPDSEYIAQNFDHVVNNTAVKEGVVRSYGFAANDNGETCYYESGYTTTFTGLAGCSRDDANQTTVYEVAIPFAEFEITPEKGMDLGFTFSINSTNDEDVKKGVWKNITFRNGGGVIGRNDWSKIPKITLG